MAEVVVERKSITAHVRRFLRNCLTGGIATAIYFAVYLPLFYWTPLSQSLADNAGLAVGAGVQFVGARYFVFRARQGALHKQIGGFVLAEIATLGMNMLLLFLGRRLLPKSVGESDLLVLVTSFVVFAGFSYPVWHLVFRKPKQKAAPEDAALPALQND
ncbi:MAG: GtrA family protein [Planctomycetes bacterium]|nr:GtrA family protein [Planctomycetota bacterium]